MAEVVENQDKTFKHFLELPENIRMFVIDEQEPDDRVRFTRCSKLCNQEAKASNNYIFQLSLYCSSDNFWRVEVDYKRYDPSVGDHEGYDLTYCKRNEQKTVEYWGRSSQDEEKIWLDVLDSSTNIAECAIEKFKILLQRYQKTVKSLHFTGTFEHFDFGVDTLDKLEDLMILGNCDIRQIFSKLHRPLKNLWLDHVENISMLSDCEELYQVQNHIGAVDLKLDKQQFLRLSAKSVVLNIGTLTERDVFKIIRSWQNGTIGKPVTSYQWYLENSNFNMQKLAKLLRACENEFDLNENYLEVEVKHFNEPGKIAALYFVLDFFFLNF